MMSARRARCLVILLAMLALAGCATSRLQGPDLEPIAPATTASLTAYRTGNTLEILFPPGGKDALARAKWSPVSKGAPAYQYRSATLALEKMDRASRKLAANPGNRLDIRDATQWQQLLHGIFAGLAPRQPGHGVLVLVEYMEIVVYRDASGIVQIVKLANKPVDIAVDDTFTERDFSREAIKQLAASASTIDRSQNQFLFLTGGYPAFALVDLRERLLVFLNYPSDPEAEPLRLPGVFAMRALNSVLVKSIALTAIKNPFTLVSRGLWHLGNSALTLLNTLPRNSDRPLPPLSTGPGMNLTHWEHDLDGLVSARRYPGHLQQYIDGDQFFPALIQSVENARTSVDVMVYIFGTDDYSIRVADVLKERSATVRVRVLMDDLGSMLAADILSHSAAPPNFPRTDNIKSYLTGGSHVQVRACADPWLATDHRKCILIDDRLAYVGGMNIGSVYRYKWHDLMFGLTGPVVSRLHKDYEKAWAFSGPVGDFAYAWKSLSYHDNPLQNAITGGIDIRPLRTATGKLQIYHAQLAAIRRAKSYIYIESAYFNDDTILRGLMAARRRGVDVRVILPSENNVAIMQTCNQVMANEMVRNGIRVYFYPGMTHVKAAIYDGWACVGSANLEKMSLRVSQELDIAYSDPEAVNQLRHDLFAADFTRSQELKTPAASSWIDTVVKAFADQL